MNRNKNKIIYGMIIFLLIALGVCIFINFERSNSNKNNNDVDVINIDCNDENCEKEVKPKNKDKKDDNSKIDNKDNSSNTNNNTNTNDNNNGTIPGNSGNGEGTESNTGTGDSDSSATTPIEEKEDFTVSDNYQVWKQQTEIKIFNVDKVAPGDHGSYDFMINNNTSKNVKYSIVFSEENKYNVNLRYKLKRNNEYVAGNSDWVRYSDLNLGDKVLNSRKNDVYTIEWKWVDADNDTAVGRTPDAKYRLSINIKAMETGEIDTSGSGSFNPYTGDNVLYYVELAILLSIILLLLIIKYRQKDEYESSKCN